ncbi:hypothetical protein ACEPPN_019190 [Leptodophora sp. 'Broadleaf-Isolate-01']
MPVTKFSVEDRYSYHHGFGSYFESEAIKGALPIGANQPQRPPFGLYAEKFSGTAFTTPRSNNLQTWLYRVLPAASHQPFEPYVSLSKTSVYQKTYHIPNQLRWDPFDLDNEVDWTDSLHLVAVAGEPALKQGVGIMIFAAGKSMRDNEAFSSADGDFLIVLQHGVLDIQTEIGRILVRPNEICVIPRGVRYRVTLRYGSVRGYILELYQGHFQLPELGPIGSQGLANVRDFQIPVAAYDYDVKTEWHHITKFNGEFFIATQNHTPFDVVGWHGNYYPYKYDLGRFNTIGSVSYDHPDPSILNVLVAPSDQDGTPIAELVVFPPRWLVMEDTFRPPQFHRNAMSEFMGLIQGNYHGKAGSFLPSGASLHNVMSGHGPDYDTHRKASDEELHPVKVGEDSMAFMFETCHIMGVTEWGLNGCNKVQKDYTKNSWESLYPLFKPPV